MQKFVQVHLSFSVQLEEPTVTPLLLLSPPSVSWCRNAAERRRRHRGAEPDGRGAGPLNRGAGPVSRSGELKMSDAGKMLMQVSVIQTQKHLTFIDLQANIGKQQNQQNLKLPGSSEPEALGSSELNHL